MTDSIYFVSGLPRSGSTLLCNLLAQNPRFYASATSGLCEVMRAVKDGWRNVDSFRAQDEQTMYTRLRQTLRAMLFGYYSDVSRPVVFDKSRSWPAYIEMLEQALGQAPKILVTVRNLADVMASWELRWRETEGLGHVRIPDGVRVDTLEERIKLYGSATHPIGGSYNIIKDAFARGHGSKLHIVEFEKLTSTPKTTVLGVYEFLGEEPHDHNFNCVEQTTQEDDREFGFIGLHNIRSKVEPIPSRWKEVIGVFGENISKQRCW